MTFLTCLDLRDFKSAEVAPLQGWFPGIPFPGFPGISRKFSFPAIPGNDKLFPGMTGMNIFGNFSKNQLISLIKPICLAINQNSDDIFVFPEVNFDNTILISSQDSDFGISTSSTYNRNFARLSLYFSIKVRSNLACRPSVRSYSLDEIMKRQNKTLEYIKIGFCSEKKFFIPVPGNSRE